MSEAPAPGGESDFGGQLEATERFGIASAFPPPQEKADEHSVHGGNQGGGGGPGKEKDENGGPATPGQLGDLAARGLGGDLPQGPGIIPDLSDEEIAAQEEEAAKEASARPEVSEETPGEEIGRTERFQTSRVRGEEEARPTTRPSGSRSQREIREATERIGSRPVEEPVVATAPPAEAEPTAAKEPVAAESPPAEAATPTPQPEAGRSLTPTEVADEYFERYQAGVQSVRFEPGGQLYQAITGSLDTTDESEPSLIFTPVDGGDDREVTLTELRAVANERAAYNPTEATEQVQPERSEDEVAADMMGLSLDEFSRLPKQGRADARRIVRDHEAEEAHHAELQERAAQRATEPKQPEPPPTEVAPTEGPIELSDRAADLFERYTTGSSFAPKPGGPRFHVKGEVPTAEGEERRWEFAGITDVRSGKEPPPNVILNENDLRRLAQNTADAEEAKSGSADGKVESEQKEPPKPEAKERTPPPPPRDRETTTASGSPEDRPEIRLGEATWKNQDSDQPVKVVGYAGTAGGRVYVRIEGSSTAVPLDEINYPSRPPPSTGARITGRAKELGESAAARVSARLRESERYQTAKERADKIAEAAPELTRRAEEGLRDAAERTENKYQKFLYNAGAGFLNRFRWADKEQGTYAAGVIVGSVTSVALGPAGNIVKIPTLIGLNSILVPGISMARVYSISNVLKPWIEDRSERWGAARQFDDAYRLIGKDDNKEAFDNEIKRLAKEVAQGSNITIISEEGIRGAIEGRMESLRKYSKAQSHIRSFAAGLSAGSITASAGEAVFHGINSWVGGGGGAPTEAPGPDSGPEPPVEEAQPSPTTVEPPPTTPPTEVPITTTPLPETITAQDLQGVAVGPRDTFIEAYNNLDSAEQRQAFVDVLSNPDRVQDLIRFSAASEAAQASSEVLSDANEVLQNPDFANSLEIAQGTTVSDLLANNGYDITWTPDDADIFGGHILANYDTLNQMHEQVKAAGIPVEFQDYPSPNEVVNLIKAAEGGDAKAFQQLVAASHWIPEGGNYNILTESGFEALKQKYGLA